MSTLNFRVVDNPDERVRIEYDIIGEDNETVLTAEMSVYAADVAGETEIVSQFVTALNNRIDSFSTADISKMNPEELRRLASDMGYVASSLTDFAARPSAG